MVNPFVVAPRLRPFWDSASLGTCDSRLIVNDGGRGPSNSGDHSPALLRVTYATQPSFHVKKLNERHVDSFLAQLI